ncbi:MAG: hypothetical protein LQ350_005975 [Teloschistes chrysophthalmus]|nr:MAG: hypothetical protein LQ350_005975 [Niorma chrysophthalma]
MAGPGRGFPGNSRSQFFLPTGLARNLDMSSSSQSPVPPPTAEPSQSQPSSSSSSSSSVPRETPTPFAGQLEEIGIIRILNAMGNDASTHLLEEGLLRLPRRQLIDTAEVWYLAAGYANSDWEVEEAMEKYLYYWSLIDMQVRRERGFRHERR